jgi:hypothetical protein
MLAFSSSVLACNPFKMIRPGRRSAAIGVPLRLPLIKQSP